MVREPDGWTFEAHGVRQYRDGTIEWDYSTGGHWPGGKPLAPVTSVAVRREGDKQPTHGPSAPALPEPGEETE